MILFSLLAEIISTSSPAGLPDWVVPTSGTGIGLGSLWAAREVYLAKRSVKRDVRSDEDRFERKANPPLHKEFIARDEFNRHVKSCPAAKNDFATRSEMRQVHDEVDQLRDDMQEEFKETRRASEESRDRMNLGIRKLEQSVSGLEKSDNEQSSTLKVISSDIKSLIAKVGNLQGKTEK